MNLHRWVIMFGFLHFFATFGILVLYGSSLSEVGVVPARIFILLLSLIVLTLSLVDIFKKPRQFFSYLFFLVSLYIGGFAFLLVFHL